MRTGAQFQVGRELQLPLLVRGEVLVLTRDLVVLGKLARGCQRSLHEIALRLLQVCVVGQLAHFFAVLELPLLADDGHLSLRVFLDNVVAECYWQGGRVAMTVPAKPATTASISATAAVQLLNATAFRMAEIMTTKEAVLEAIAHE